MIAVLLCAWNEADGIGRLVQRIAASASDGVGVLVLVDDGSRDGTAARAREAADAAGLPLVVLTHGVNRGLGAALRTGFDWAVANLAAADLLITMDADNTHPPEMMPRLVERIAAGADLAIASRYQQGARQRGVPLHRRWLSGGVRSLVERLARVPGARDYTCGYRAYRVGLLQRAHGRGSWPLSHERGFAAMLEVLLVLGALDARIEEVPLELHYDERGAGSKMRVVRTLTRTLRVVWRHRRPAPRRVAGAAG